MRLHPRPSEYSSCPSDRSSYPAADGNLGSTYRVYRRAPTARHRIAYLPGNGTHFSRVRDIRCAITTSHHRQTMNTAYSQEPYRPAGPGVYAAAPMHNQYNPMPVSRAPMPDSMNKPSDALASLAPGAQPTSQEPQAISCVEKGWKYE